MKMPKKVDPSKMNIIYMWVEFLKKRSRSFLPGNNRFEIKRNCCWRWRRKEKLEKQYPNIEFVGWKNKDEVKQYMKGARALIFPSRWYETAGLTVLEAMQYRYYPFNFKQLHYKRICARK